MHFETWQWGLAIAGALLVGFSKTGVAGLGMLFVVMFAQILPAKQATGIVLPLLCFGDVVAVLSYRRHAKIAHVLKLFPWAAAGVIVGYFSMSHINEQQARWLIGSIVLGLVALHLIRRRGAKGQEAEHGWWFAPMVGVLAGFTTLMANAAGPLMAIYLLAMRLPKMEYVGTGALFFFFLNLFKVPFMVKLGLITGGSFTVNLILAPAVLVGAWLGWTFLPKINQRVFENLALSLSVVAAFDLIFRFSSRIHFH